MKLKEIVFLVEEDPEGGYDARSIEYSIFTQAETMEELKINIRNALCCHFDTKEDIPAIIRLHIVRDETLMYA